MLVEGKATKPVPGTASSRVRGRGIPGRIALALCLLAVSVSAASALGRREDPIVQADKLIADQRFNEAIAYLTEFIQKYPDRFDAAQKRIQTVIARREQYNKTTNDLLATMQKEPSNDEKILAMIAQMESLERNPTPFAKATIVKLKETRLALKNQDIMAEIMTRGRRLIDQGKYVDAARAYEEGLVLFKPEFDSAGYDRITMSAVNGLVERAKSGLPGFAAEQSSFSDAVEGLRRAFAAGDPAAAEAAWPAARTALVEAAKRRLEESAAGKGLSDWSESIPKEGKSIIEYSFMSYANLFIRGRPDGLPKKPEAEKGKPEGIAGAMLAHWGAALDSLQAAVEPALASAFAGAERAYDAGDWGAAQAAFDRSAKLSRPALRTLGLWSLAASTEVVRDLSPVGKAVVGPKAVAYERIRHLGEAAAAGSRLSALASRASRADADAQAFAAALPAGTPVPDALAGLARYRDALLALQGSLQTERAASGTLAAELARWTAAGLADPRSAPVQGTLDGRIAAAIERAKAFEVAVVARAGGVEYAAFDRDFAARREAIDRGRGYLEGIASTDPALAGLVIRQPSQTIRLMNEQAVAIAALRRTVSEFLERYRREVPYVAGAAAVLTWIERARDLDRSAAELQSTGSALLASATKQKRDADLGRGAAEVAFAQSRANLTGNRFEQALRSLEDSRLRFSESLSLEYDVALRSDSDARIQSLNDEIRRKWNDKVVKDTNDLLDQGQRFYVSGDFPKAETNLLAAQEAWKPTHSEANTLVTYWLRLTRNALSVTTGSDIPQTDERYAEVSQTLNQARAFVEAGNALLAQKNKSDALVSFNKAKGLIETIVKAFPLNQDARILSLQIDQKSDPERFAQNFQNRLSAARARLGTDTAKAYADLKSLAAIDPRFPGLRGALDEAEYALGIKARPPDPANIARARQIVDQAQAIFNRGDPNQFSMVRNLLNQAFALDPSNAGIKALMNRIDTFQGGSGNLVLSDAAQKQYDKAAQLYASGDSLGALAIVQELIKDPKNSVPKVRDLYDRLTR